MTILTTDHRLRLLLNASKAQLEAIDRVLFRETVREPVIGPLLLRMSDAADYLGVSRATLWRMLQAGRLEKVELFHGSYRVRRADIEALVRRGAPPRSAPDVAEP